MGDRVPTEIHEVLTMSAAQRAQLMQRAGSIISSGGLVAFPTETVYGLGADGLNPEAVRRAFAVKGRPSDNPLILHVAGADAVAELVDDLGPLERQLMDRFWPGPLTLVLSASPLVPLEVTADLTTVAIRCPDHPIALELIRAANTPIAGPSANLSGRPSPTTAQHVERDLGGKIDMILDGGPSGIGVESTVLDLSGARPRILRPGGLTREKLEEVLGPVDVVGLVPDEPALSPGMLHRHYSPRASLYVVDGCEDLLVEAMLRLGQQLRQRGMRVGYLVTQDSASAMASEAVTAVGQRRRPDLVARELFAILRRMDDQGLDAIIAESMVPMGLGLAVADRLSRAAVAVVDAAVAAECLLDGPVLLVCSGNTCRSAMAEIMLRGLRPDLLVASAGIAATEGVPATPGAVVAARSRGLDLRDHRSRPVTLGLVAEARLILTMTGAHKEAVLAGFPEARGKTWVLAEFVEGPGAGDVIDPFGGDDRDYEETALRLEQLLEGLRRDDA